MLNFLDFEEKQGKIEVEKKKQNDQQRSSEEVKFILVSKEHCLVTK